MICNECGNKNKGNSKFCGYCGAELIQTIKEKEKISPVKFIALMISIIIIVVIIFVSLYDIYITHKFDSDGIKKALVESNAIIVDENGHIHNITIEDTNCIVKVYDIYADLRSAYASIDIDLGAGYLQDVRVTFEHSFFGNKIKNITWQWNYWKEYDGEPDTRAASFVYKFQPNYTIKDCMNFLGIYDDYISADIRLSSIHVSYDWLEYMIFWQEYDGDIIYDWIRIEYNSHTNSWTMTKAIECNTPFGYTFGSSNPENFLSGEDLNQQLDPYHSARFSLSSGVVDNYNLPDISN